MAGSEWGDKGKLECGSGGGGELCGSGGREDSMGGKSSEAVDGQMALDPSPPAMSRFVPLCPALSRFVPLLFPLGGSHIFRSRVSGVYRNPYLRVRALSSVERPMSV
jgi:hypothetical protein